MNQNSKNSVAAIVLAAGKGTRMRSTLPKVMHPVGGRPMIDHVLETVRAAGASKVVVVVSPDMCALADRFHDAAIAVQEQPRGTGDAARSAIQALRGFSGTVLVLFGADPLVSRSTLERLIQARETENPPSLVILGFRPNDPAQYGRLVVDSGGRLERIVEYWDADDSERQIDLCNSGVLAADAETLFELLPLLKNDNNKGEFYLTDVVGLATASGQHCSFVEGDARELIGVDSRSDLAQAEAAFQAHARETAMASGVTLVDPSTVWFAFDTSVGADVVLEPNVVFGPGVVVEEGATIRAFSHLEGCTIRRGATVGPFARLRPGADIGAGARVGNFVEVKNAELQAGAKVNHLTYVGDATVGEGANIGAGTITANYDGYRKSKTTIGARASIGSNSVLVAPVTVGEDATVGAGSVVREDVPAGALRASDTRKLDVTKAGWSEAKRKKSLGDS